MTGRCGVSPFGWVPEDGLSRPQQGREAFPQKWIPAIHN